MTLVQNPDAPPRAGRKEWVGLAVLALPLLLVSMDVSVLYFAVPFISADLHASATEQLWIFDVYGFVLAGLLITMGSLGDRIGRRRLLILGALAFGGASVAAAYSGSPRVLIAARALLAIGGATLMPSTLALIRTMFHDPAQRSRAIAVWSAVMMGGISIGPVLSGLLLEHFWWGSVFLINTPVMVLLVALAPVLLPEFRAPAQGRFDLLSSALSLAAVLPFVYGIKSWAADGLSLLAVMALVVGAGFAVVFLRRQRHLAYPMIDLSSFRNRRYSGGIGANVIAMFALVGNAVFLTQFLQLVLAMSPLTAALWSLAPSVVVAAAAPTTQGLSQRFPVPHVMSGGLVVAAAGFAVITQVHVASPLAVLLVGAALVSSGLVAVMTLVTELVVGAVPPERAGSASAVMETGSELGGALGIALLGSIGGAAYRASVDGHLRVGLPARLADVGHDGLPGAVAAARDLPGPLAASVLDVARDAFAHGMDVEAGVAGAVLLVAAVLVPRLLHRAV
jgi:DHA2 family multidrug resistance protein-like MFS transporter